MDREDIAARLREFFKTRMLPQNEVARRCGVTSGCMSRVINGHMSPSLKLLTAMRREFGLSLDSVILPCPPPASETRIPIRFEVELVIGGLDTDALVASLRAGVEAVKRDLSARLESVLNEDRNPEQED